MLPFKHSFGIVRTCILKKYQISIFNIVAFFFDSCKEVFIFTTNSKDKFVRFIQNSKLKFN